MGAAGVSSKQTGRARQVMLRSAEMAGFFEQGRERLVMPVGLTPRVDEVKSQESQQAEERPYPPLKEIVRPTFEQDMKIMLHPFIQGLLKEIPEPGNPWPAEKRKKWLTTADHIFELLYGDGS